MPTNTRRERVIRCDTPGCEATISRPRLGSRFPGAYEAGWRWRGNPEERPLRFAPHTIVASCPNCPPVAVY